MLFKIAWRNLWRNKRRSLIILSSVIVGVVVVMLNDGLGKGMIREMLNNQININVAHIQIHKNGFNDNKNIHKLIPNLKKVEKVLAKEKFIKYYSKRTIVYGLVSSANSSSGAVIMGVEPDKEKKVTDISSKIIKGTYLTGESNEIVIGNKAAEKLEVDIGDKIVTIASDINGNVSNRLFRVVGIFKTASSDFNRRYIYIPLKSAQTMLGIGNNIHEIAIITDNEKKVSLFKNILLKQLNNNYEVLSYKDLLPMIMTYIDSYDEMIGIFYLIIGLAVLFGIVNTMLMSVFERVQEFGVLMSIGMKSSKIFEMVMSEALMLGILGTIIGFIVALILYYPLSIYGIDYSYFSEGLSSFGISHIIYPVLDINGIINSLLIIPFVTLIGAIYPAIKAVKLQPTDAMRYV